MLRLAFNTCRNTARISNHVIFNNNNNVINIKHVIPLCGNSNLSAYLQYCTNPSYMPQEHIYTGLLAKQVKGVKLLCLSSSIMGLCFQPIIFQKIMEHGASAFLVGAGTFIGFFTFVTPLLLHWITKKYVTDIEYNPITKMYTAFRYSFFLRKLKIPFTPNDVEVPDVLGMFTSFNIKGIPVFIELSNFKDPKHYEKIMGYDKPIVFKLDEIGLQTTEEIKKKS